MDHGTAGRLARPDTPAVVEDRDLGIGPLALNRLDHGVPQSANSEVQFGARCAEQADGCRRHGISSAGSGQAIGSAGTSCPQRSDSDATIRPLATTIGATLDLWDFVRLLVRRWYLTVPLLALAAAAALFAAQGVAPTYTASATGAFLEPAIILQPDEVVPNPWALAGPETTARAVVDSVADPITTDQVAAEGYSRNYEIKLASRSVLFGILASAPTPEGATTTLDHVVDLMRQDLRNKQASYGVPESQQVLIQMASGTSIVATRDSLKRVLLVVIGLGGILTGLIVFIVDSIVGHRARHRAMSDDTTDGEAEASSNDVDGEDHEKAGSDGSEVSDDASTDEETVATELTSDEVHGDSADDERASDDRRIISTSAPQKK